MRRFGLIAAVALFTGEAALAADMPAWSVPSAIAAPVRSTSAWYLRGDIGYGWFRTDGAVAAPGFPNPLENNPGSGLVGGIGFGHSSTWLRADATLDYTRINYSGSIAAHDDVMAKVTAVTVLANGYLDLGTWYGLTPYVGAGAGASHLKTSDYTSALAPPFTPGLSNTQWRFAWALMAGAAFQATPNVALDLGYRYLDLGDVSTAADSAGAMTLKKLAAHEVRVGVRWSFDDVPLPH